MTIIEITKGAFISLRNLPYKVWKKVHSFSRRKKVEYSYIKNWEVQRSDQSQPND